MKSPLLALAIATVSALPTLAADLPYRKGPPQPYVPPPPVFTWTGFYVGVNAGGIISQNSRATESGSVAGFVPGGFVPGSYTARDTGFIGGGQIGYNYQMASLVAGLEADFQGTTLSKSTTVIAPLGSTVGTFKDQLNWLGTVRGRLGFTPTERLLLYATGGLAYGGVKLSHSLTDTVGLFSPAGTVLSGSSTNTRVGWTLGGGLEYALTPNWTIKGEYLFYDLGKQSVTASNPFVTPATSTLTVSEKGSIFRAGLNYKFW